MTLIDELVRALRGMKESTKVLGSGIGKIATPDGFFAKWNDAECNATDALRRAEREKSVVLSEEDVHFLHRVLSRYANEDVWVAVHVPRSEDPTPFCALAKGTLPEGQAPATDMKAVLALLDKREGEL